MQTSAGIPAADIKDFEDFYTTKIEPVLPRLRAECRKMDISHLLYVLAAILGFGSFIGYYAGLFSGSTAAWLFVFFAAAVVFCVYLFSKRKDRFTADYKTALIKEIINHICPGLVYKPDDFIDANEYKTSRLYRRYYDYYDGDDYLEGIINDTSFRCCELHTQYDDAGNYQVTIFKGLFFVANISSRFNAGTYVWPVEKVQLSASIMDEGYRLIPMPQIADIHIRDAEFTSYFRVCGTDPQQATEILSNEMRAGMLWLRKKLNRPVSFSFVVGHCYIAIPVRDDLLEPSDYDPGDKEEIQKYFLTIGMISGVIKHLPLDAL